MTWRDLGRYLLSYTRLWTSKNECYDTLKGHDHAACADLIKQSYNACHSSFVNGTGLMLCVTHVLAETMMSRLIKLSNLTSPNTPSLILPHPLLRLTNDEAVVLHNPDHPRT